MYRDMKFRLPGAGFLAILALCAGLDGARAQTGGSQGLFTVSDVSVDETAETASSARSIALAAGQREAFRRLLDRLTAQSDRARLPAPDAQTMESVVQALEIDNEKTSAVRYLADLTVTFRPDAVRSWLRSNAIPYAETRSRPVLVLPVLLRGGTYVLWDEPNPWRAAWSSLPSRDGLVPLAVPVGDLEDLSDVTAQQAVDGDRAALAQIAARYGAGDVLVAVGEAEGDGPSGLSVAASRIRPDVMPAPAPGAESAAGATAPTAPTAPSATSDASMQDGPSPIVLAFRRGEGESADALMARAALGVSDAVEDAWKAENLIHWGQLGRLRAAIPLTGLSDWLSVRGSLDSMAIVDTYRVIALTRDSADVEIDYLGGVNQLSQALAQRNLTLEDAAASLPTQPANAYALPAGAGVFGASGTPGAGEGPGYVLRLRRP